MVAALAAGGLVVGLRGRATPPATTTVPLGVYAGYTNTRGVAEVSQLLGHPLSQAMDFFDPTSWSAIVTSPTLIVPAWQGTPYQMTWGVPMLPDTGASLATGATGAYDHYFLTVAQYLVAHGQGSSFIRLGWEFNGNWFTWSAAHCPSCFVTYWRHIVTTMRSVPGAAFRFEWNPTIGTNYLRPTDAYPGNRYVDVVALDVYDAVRGVSGTAARWHHFLDEPYGLKWLVSFAKAHGKPIAFPEWGLWTPPEGKGDDPAFVTEMAKFIAAQPNVVSALYWDFQASTLDQVPMSKAAFKAAFG